MTKAAKYEISTIPSLLPALLFLTAATPFAIAKEIRHGLPCELSQTSLNFESSSSFVCFAHAFKVFVGLLICPGRCTLAVGAPNFPDLQLTRLRVVRCGFALLWGAK